MSIYPDKLLGKKFFRQIFAKFWFFSGNLKKSIFQAKIAYLQLLLGKFLYFSSKVTTFETYFLYMIRYNNISRPVYNPPATPHDPPCPKSGVATPNPQDWRPCYRRVRLYVRQRVDVAGDRLLETTVNWNWSRAPKHLLPLILWTYNLRPRPNYFHLPVEDQRIFFIKLLHLYSPTWRGAI